MGAADQGDRRNDCNSRFLLLARGGKVPRLARGESRLTRVFKSGTDEREPQGTPPSSQPANAAANARLPAERELGVRTIGREARPVSARMRRPERGFDGATIGKPSNRGLLSDPQTSPLSVRSLMSPFPTSKRVKSWRKSTCDCRTESARSCRASRAVYLLGCGPRKIDWGTPIADAAREVAR